LEATHTHSHTHTQLMEDVTTCLSLIPRDFLARLRSGSLRRGRTELTHNVQAPAECTFYQVQDPKKEIFGAHELARPCRQADLEMANSHFHTWREIPILMHVVDAASKEWGTEKKVGTATTQKGSSRGVSGQRREV
jgi:hypothetical protein